MKIKRYEKNNYNCSRYILHCKLNKNKHTKVLNKFMKYCDETIGIRVKVLKINTKHHDQFITFSYLFFVLHSTEIYYYFCMYL